jgi:hypothetical protein
MGWRDSPGELWFPTHSPKRDGWGAAHPSLFGEWRAKY